MIRCHGDFHLDEVLMVDDDTVFIDFEGDPDCTVGERQIKRSPLRDVATMLRSFQYAASTALNQLDESAGAGGGEGRSRYEPWARYWELWAGVSFLRAYLQSAAGAPFLPADREHVAVLLDTFMLERALHELGHELQAHPNGASVPIEGILRIMEGRAEVAQRV